MVSAVSALVFFFLCPRTGPSPLGQSWPPCSCLCSCCCLAVCWACCSLCCQLRLSWFYVLFYYPCPTLPCHFPDNVVLSCWVRLVLFLGVLSAFNLFHLPICINLLLSPSVGAPFFFRVPFLFVGPCVLPLGWGLCVGRSLGDLVPL